MFNYKRLAEMQAKYDQLLDEYHDTRDVLATLKESNDTTLGVLEGITRDLEQARKDLEQKLEELSKVRLERAQLELLNNRLRDEIASCQETIGRLCDHITAIREVANKEV